MTDHPIDTTVRVRDDAHSRHAGMTGTVVERIDSPTEPRPVLVRGKTDGATWTALYADADLDAVDAVPPCPTCDELTARIAGLEADLHASEDRGDRFLAALQRALPGHYDSVLWFHYTASRWSIFEKFRAWVESPKNTVGPFDALHWMQVFGVLEGDVVRAEPTPEGEVSHD